MEEPRDGLNIFFQINQRGYRYWFHQETYYDAITYHTFGFWFFAIGWFIW